MFVKCFIEVFRRNDLTSTALHKLTDKSSSIFFDEIFEIVFIVFDRLLRVFELTSIEAWNFGEGDVIWFFVVLAPFIGTYLHTFSSNSMISSLKSNNTFLIRVEFSHLQCYIISFRPRINKSHYTQLFW